MSKLEQHSDFITETDNFYDALEVTAGQYYEALSNAMEHQRKMNARRSDEQNG
jgi:hypothetical protein